MLKELCSASAKPSLNRLVISSQSWLGGAQIVMSKWSSETDDYNQSDLKELSSRQLEKMLEPQVWREAATQVFFALGLGFGGVIAFSSYNKRDNNCHFDAALVSVINFVTSILATLVVFAVLGFKANVMNEKCVVE